MPQWHDFFKKNNKNNTGFLGAETAKGVQSTQDCTPFCQEKKRKTKKNYVIRNNYINSTKKVIS